jgi:hypothetical protein
MPLPASYETIPVRTRCADDADRGFLDTLFASDGRIEMALAAGRSRLGESIEGIFCVETEKPLNCNAIRVRLKAAVIIAERTFLVHYFT